jgi:hypothetical protein
MFRPLRGAVACLWLMCFTSPARAQHHEHMHAPPPARAPAPYPLFQTDMRRMTGMVPVDPMGPMPGWQFMTAGVVRFGYNRQGGERGDEGFESTNWLMGMAHHDLGPGRVTFMMMNSLEPATLDDPGSPQLFQTGETFDGEPIVDYQHAHDFFMNLSATYRAGISPRSGVWVQLAPVGEPALGPVAFMHRASSGDNPSAPLGHHWQDATHITYNVATVGGGWDRVGLDLSAFHGGEPDEDRWNIDGGDIDSYSGRLSVNLSRDWSVMASYGDLNDPHPEVPGDATRTHVSLEYGAAGDRANGLLLLWGRNDEDHGVSDSFLAEYAHQFARHQLFGRVEWVEKDEQLLATREHTHDQGEDTPLADVTALTLGYFHSGRIFSGLGIGGDATFYVVPTSLQSEYGDFPVSIHVFLRARWLSATGGHHH